MAKKACGAQLAEHRILSGAVLLGLVEIDFNIALDIALIERAQGTAIHVIAGDCAVLPPARGSPVA